MPPPRLHEEILHHLFSKVWERTLSEGIDGEFAVRVLRQVLKRDFRLALSYHQVYDDHALVYNGPGRVAQSVGEGAKDLRNAGFARVGRDEDVFDILGLWGGELRVKSVGCDNGVSRHAAVAEGEAHVSRMYLDLGAALNALLEGARHVSVTGLVGGLCMSEWAAGGGRCVWLVMFLGSCRGAWAGVSIAAWRWSKGYGQTRLLTASNNGEGESSQACRVAANCGLFASTGVM